MAHIPLLVFSKLKFISQGGNERSDFFFFFLMGPDEGNELRGEGIRNPIHLCWLRKGVGAPCTLRRAAGHSEFYYIINLDPSGFKERG